MVPLWAVGAPFGVFSEDQPGSTHPERLLVFHTTAFLKTGGSAVGSAYPRAWRGFGREGRRQRTPRPLGPLTKSVGGGVVACSNLSGAHGHSVTHIVQSLSLLVARFVCGACPSCVWLLYVNCSGYTYYRPATTCSK